MAVGRIFGTIVKGFSQLIAPNVCRICGQSLVANEHVMCLHCLLELPRTNVHHSDFNEIHRRLGHHVKVDRAAGWFHYKKGSPFAQLLIDAKYNSLPDIDYQLGRQCARELQRDRFFDGIEVIVPMPMYWWKRLRRGYNQAMEIGRGVSDTTSIPVADALKAIRTHGVQARHNRSQRFASIADTIEINRPDDINGRHVLLVDDIITSGASCMEALRALDRANPASISVLSLGLTTVLGF